MAKHKIPFLAISEDVGQRDTVAEGTSELSGAYVVEDVEFDASNGSRKRRLVFLGSRGLVQTEVRCVVAGVVGQACLLKACMGGVHDNARGLVHRMRAKRKPGRRKKVGGACVQSECAECLWTEASSYILLGHQRHCGNRLVHSRYQLTTAECWMAPTKSCWRPSCLCSLHCSAPQLPCRQPQPQPMAVLAQVAELELMLGLTLLVVRRAAAPRHASRCWCLG